MTSAIVSTESCEGRAQDEVWLRRPTSMLVMSIAILVTALNIVSRRRVVRDF